MTSFKVDDSVLVNELSKYIKDVTTVHMKDAANKMAEFIAAAYRKVLSKQIAKPGNPSFKHAQDAIAIKTGLFSDLSGAWYVVGPAVTDGRLEAPQMQFNEFGTVERKTKAGANRGQVLARLWLTTVEAMTASQVKDIGLKRLIKLVN